MADFPEVGKGNTLSIPEISIDGDNEDDNDEDDTPACVEESEDIAICIDTVSNTWLAAEIGNLGTKKKQ